MKFALIPLLVSLATASVAEASLRQEKPINDGLIAVAVADEIRKNCGDISPRYFRAISYMSSLKRQAGELGYSAAEIKEFVGNETDKARVAAAAQEYLVGQGVSAGDSASYCAAGHGEIAAGSASGRLLRAK
jgi:uncharacterized protein DUF5333